MNKHQTNWEKAKEIITYFIIIIIMGVVLIVGFNVISFLIEKSDGLNGFERGFYEGYKQGLDENYFNGWNDCRNNYQLNTLL